MKYLIQRTDQSKCRLILHLFNIQNKTAMINLLSPVLYMLFSWGFQLVVLFIYLVFFFLFHNVYTVRCSVFCFFDLKKMYSKGFVITRI